LDDIPNIFLDSFFFSPKNISFIFPTHCPNLSVRASGSLSVSIPDFVVDDKNPAFLERVKIVSRSLENMLFSVLQKYGVVELEYP
jgi:hypothetical protein